MDTRITTKSMGNTLVFTNTEKRAILREVRFGPVVQWIGRDFAEVAM